MSPESGRTSTVKEFIDRYVAVWHEPDADLRRQAVAALWTPDGAHFIDSLSARGHDALVARVAQVYNDFIGTGEYVFRAAGDAVAHHDAAAFAWHMVPPDGGEVAATGFDFFLLASDGRIRVDHQFTEPPQVSPELDELAAHHLALWAEPGAGRRRAGVAALWSESGVHVGPAREARGREAIEAAVEEDVKEGTAPRRLAGHAQSYIKEAEGDRNVVRYSWAAEGGASGFDFLIRDDDGRARLGYRFVD
jgi:hypothetical protein